MGRTIWQAYWVAGYLGLAVGLSACGFAPVYGEKSAGVTAQTALDQVQISTINERLLGLEVRNNLIDQMNPNGEPVSPLYRLDVSLKQSRGGVLVQPDASVTRYEYSLTADYRLIDLDKGDILTSGKFTARASYNVVDSEYATLVSRQDAQKRAAGTLSDELSMRIALYFNGRAS